MPAYHYVVITNNGQQQKGVIEADSEKNARQLLRDKSFIPIKVTPAQEKKAAGKSAEFSGLLKQRGLTSKELALMTRQLATLLSAGLPVEEALAAVGEQAEKARIQGLI